MSAIAKPIDSKGRISLGPNWANRYAFVEKVDETEVRIVLARVIPEREAWLYENPEAMAMVQRGLQECREGLVAEAPDLDAVDTDDEDA